MRLQSNHRAFVKKHGSDVAEDWASVQQLDALCRQIQDIHTATPLSFDAANGTISYEYLEGLEPALSRSGRARVAPRRIGGAIAQLHLARSSDDVVGDRTAADPLRLLNMTSECSDSLMTQFPRGFFHGDCWYGNVLTDTGGRLIVLDPIPNPYVFGRPKMERACGALDLGMMFMSVFFCIPLAHMARPALAARLDTADEILCGYADTAGISICRKEFLFMSRQLALRHIASYRQRLAFPIALIKTVAAGKILRELDIAIGWNQL